LLLLGFPLLDKMRCEASSDQLLIQSQKHIPMQERKHYTHRVSFSMIFNNMKKRRLLPKSLWCYSAPLETHSAK